MEYYTIENKCIFALYKSFINYSNKNMKENDTRIKKELLYLDINRITST